MKAGALLLILMAFGNAQETKKGSHFQQNCPPLCTCLTVQDNAEPTVFYMMATCQQMPSHLDNGIRYLTVKGGIDIITKNMITALGTSLRRLDLSNCMITSIEKGAFSSLLIHLKSLILSNNKLTKLEEDVFKCPNLEELFLDGNDLREIHDNTFQQLVKLKYLYLQHNTLQKCSFNLPTTLFHLDLFSNGIHSFDIDLNKGQLHHLDLCDNHFKGFPFKDSTRSNHLASLCLSGQATHLPEQFATRFPSLQNLTLEGPAINKIDLAVKTQNEIRNLGNLKILSIEYFHIQNLDFVIDKKTITILALKNITLDNKAGIQKVFKTLSYLDKLYIDGSPDLVKPLLEDGSVVSALIRLQYLSIQSTKLVSIAEHNIPSSVIQLNIAQNPLRCDCNISWIVVKQKTSGGGYLQNVAGTTCSTPAQYDGQELYSVVNPGNCPGTSNGRLEQTVTPSPSPEGQGTGMQQQTDHTVLYIILGCCLLILLVIGITLAIVLSVMKRKRRLQIAPEGGETQMEQQQQQQQIKQASSHDMLLKK